MAVYSIFTTNMLQSKQKHIQSVAKMNGIKIIIIFFLFFAERDCAGFAVQNNNYKQLWFAQIHMQAATTEKEIARRMKKDEKNVCNSICVAH